jgi:hypothetical protein
MDTLNRTVSYLFILSLILIVVAYYAGSQAVLGTLISGANTLGQTYTGRDAQGNFAAYPK